MILITGSRTRRTGSTLAFAEARAEFERTGCFTLPGLLDSGLLEELLAAADRADFYERVHDGIGVELCAAPGALSSALEFMLNDPALLDLLSEITGCGPFGCFEGRVYRLHPGSGHHDSWHSDVGQDRLVAMSINLGRERFEGGLLQIRRTDASTVCEIANPVAGDAIIFRIDPVFRHRVAPLAGIVPRTAYAGWFRARPDFQALLRKKLEALATPFRE